MAINKTFVPHTELKAQDLNELVTQANAADAAERARAEADLAAEVLARDAAIATEQARAEAEEAKKPNKVELYGFDHSLPLPLDATYYYKGLPTHSVQGVAYDSVNEIYTDYIGICIEHESDDNYEPQHHNVQLFVKTNGDYIYSETFNTYEASGYLEMHVARALGSANATPGSSGLMSATDKSLFDDVVTEVFPVKVVISSSNADVREVGTSVTPTIVLSITRKGADVSSSANVVVTPSGTVGADGKTITDSAISSGSKTYHIAVTQGGQTVSPANQKFDFKNYLYKGAFSSDQKAAVKANLVSAIKSKTKVLSDDKTLAQTTLAGGDCYLFAVKGHVTLVVKNAKSGGTISVDSSDKGFITDFPQENNPSLTNEYSWIIVPASSNTWYFQITNS